MRRLANTAIAFLTLFSGLLLPPGLTVFAQDNTTPSTTNTAPAENDNLVSQIISAAEKDGVRVIVIDGTAQQDNSGEPNSAGIYQPSADDYENLTMNTDALTTPGGSAFTKIQSGVLEFRAIARAGIFIRTFTLSTGQFCYSLLAPGWNTRSTLSTSLHIG